MKYIIILTVMLMASQIYAQEIQQGRHTTVTAYAINCGLLTADGTRLKPDSKVAAVSRQAEKRYPIGSTISVQGAGTFVVRDRMARKIKGEVIDLWMWSVHKAKLFGRQKRIVRLIK